LKKKYKRFTMAEADEQMYKNQLEMVEKLEQSVSQLADTEQSITRTPKLRKIKSSAKGIRSGFEDVPVDGGNIELIVKYRMLKIRFNSCMSDFE
jgi:hypothetical protein